MPMVIPSVSLPAILSGFSLPEFHIFGCGSLHREISFQRLNNIARIVYRAKPMLVSAVLDRVPLRPGIGENNMMVRPIVWQTGDASELGDRQKALDYYNQALPLRLAVGDRYGQALTLSNMGAVYY